MASEEGECAGTGEGEGEQRAEAGGGEAAARAPVRYCAVYTCLHNYKTHPHLSYFTIPTPPKRRMKWLKKIRRMDILKNGKVSGYHRVCEAHFKPEDIGLTATGRRKRLEPRALPALQLPQGDCFITVNEPRPRPRPRAAPPPPPTPPPPPPASPPPLAPARQAPAPAQPRTRTLTASEMEIFEYIDNAPRRLARKRPRPETEPRLWRRPPVAPTAPLADFFATCDRHLNRDMAEFVKTIARLGETLNDSSHGSCVNLLVGAPAAYRMLAPALGLPAPATLRRALRQAGDARLRDLLKLRAERMTETERDCTVSVDVVDVRPHLYYDITSDRIIGLHEVDGVQEPWPARHCAVLTARALRGAWTQPVAVCCLAQLDAGLHAWTDGVLEQLHAAGLRVRALVLDPGSPAPRRPDVSAANPFFRVKEHKVYLLYDPPRLMRLLLCNFMKYDFHFERTIAKWDDVVRYRELERHKRLTLTPQLTDALTGAAASRRARALTPRRAARLLSRALAAALAGYGERGLLGESAPATVNLILKINDLFDILDSPATGAGRTRAGGSTEDSGRTGFLSYMKTFFGGLKLKDSSGVEAPESTEFTERWRVSIAAVLALRGRPATRRMHLDARVEAAARRAAPGPPTCRRMLATFQKRFFNEILRPTEGEAVDLNGFLMRANSIDEPAVGGRERIEFEEEAEVRGRDYRRGWQRRGGVAGVAARLLRAARRVHGACGEAAGYLAAASAPDAELLRLVRVLDAALLAGLRARRQAARARLGEVLVDVLALDCDAPCGCFPLQYIKRLFLRMRLHDILRQNQAAFKKCGDDVKFRLEALR